MEAHHLSDEEKESGKGRSQVMNLLILDTGTIAGLATKVWNLTNAMIGRKSALNCNTRFASMLTVVVLIGTYMLWQLFGISSFVGIGFIPLMSPFGYYIAKNIYRKSYLGSRLTVSVADRTECDKSWARTRDARIGGIKEMLMSMKVIKVCRAFAGERISR